LDNKVLGEENMFYCGEDHYSASCEKIKDMPVRKDLIRRDGRCFICLAKEHSAAVLNDITNAITDTTNHSVKYHNLQLTHSNVK